MQFDQIVNSIGAQFKVIWAAPFPFIVVVGIVALLIWRAMEWRYGGAIARLKDQAEIRSQAPVAAAVESGPLDPPAKALRSLRLARDNAAIAVAQGNESTQLRAFHEIQAAMLSIKREFGIEPVGVTATKGTKPYKSILQLYIGVIDQIYPMLMEGHIKEARETAFAFKWTWVDPPSPPS